MYQINHSEDTIAAIATAPGTGGIGIIRLSGKEAVAVADKVFLSKKNKKPSSFKSFSVHYGSIVRPKTNEPIDEALLTVMRGPKSYTKEDVVEISCHGGPVSLRAILDLLLDCGARLAEPGEFTKRAFLNGRIDLAQAEAVLDIIQAKTDAFLKVSLNQLKGELSVELESIREELMKIYVELEAIVNFPEDDLDASGRAQIEKTVQGVCGRIKKLIDSGAQGRILKEGIKIVLCGKPNVGKSSLLNLLLRQERAIVSSIAGTTRDTIEETAQIRGIPFQLVDTAGMLEPRDLIEEEAIRRSRQSIEQADLILLMLDAATGLEEQDQQLIERVKGKSVLVLINKSDIGRSIDEKILLDDFKGKKILKISVLKRQGIDELEQAVFESVWQGKTSENSGLIVYNLRHLNSLKECLRQIEKMREILENKMSLEFASEEIKLAVNSLDSITGRNIDADLLDQIFSSFCIGK